MILLFFPSTLVYYVTIFIFGNSVPLKNMIAYTHMMEFLPGRVTEISGYLFFTEGMILVVSPLILQFVSNNTNIFLWAGLIQNLIAVTAFAVIRIPESVIFLLEKHRFKEAKREIKYLMDYNKAGQPDRVECDMLLERYVMK